jgi:FkbM family methyltransferase
MKSYSQVNQDLWVLEILKNKTKGYFLDIGAFDGINLSNSYLLETEFDWKGICVEALPSNFNSLLNSRKCNCLNLAITDSIGSSFIGPGGLTSRITDESPNSISISTTTFKQLFEDHNVPETIDYLSLDIEGSEYLALTKFPFDTHKCLTITVEHNLYSEGSERKNQIKEILLANGYVLIRENVSHNNCPFEDWYIHSSIKI